MNGSAIRPSEDAARHRLAAATGDLGSLGGDRATRKAASARGVPADANGNGAPRISHRRFAALIAAASLALALTFAPAAPAATGYKQVGSFLSTPSACPSTNPGEFCNSGRTAVDYDTGNVYVVDQASGRVQVFAPDGDSATFLTEITGLDAPYGIAIDQSASPISVYVSQAGSTNQITKFDSDGGGIPTFTADPGFTSPGQGLAAGKIQSFRAPLAIEPTSGALLVADAGRNLIQRYNADTGAFLSDIDGSDSPDGSFTTLEDIATSDTGKIFVVDSQPGGAAGGLPSRVERYSSSGAYEATLRSLQTEGDGLLAYDDASSNLIVADARILVGGQLRILDANTGALVSRYYPNAYVQITGLAVDNGASGRLYLASDDAQCGYGCATNGGYVLDPVELPDAVVQPATGVSFTTATLHGTVDPNGSDTTARFEASYDGGASWYTVGDVAPPPGNGNDPVSVSIEATGLGAALAYQYRLVAVQVGGGEVISPTTESFTTATVAAPVVTIDPVTTFDADSATLSGTIDPGGANPAFDTTYHFEYATQADFSNAQSTPDAIVSGAGAQPVSADIAGLLPNVDYYARLVASNLGGSTTSSPDVQFHTTAIGPEVVTDGASLIQDTGAKINGHVDANGSQTTYWFEWGTSDCSTSSCASIPVSEDGNAGAGANPAHVDQTLTGLTAGTTYHYRVVATNGVGGEVAGDDRTFTTEATPGACPNAEIREQQHSTQLPECRAYELVNPPSTKNGDFLRVPAISDDGNIGAFMTTSPGPESTGGALTSTLVGRRTPTGWTTTSADPHVFAGAPGSQGATNNPVAFSSDFTRVVFGSSNGLAPGDAGGPDAYLRTVGAENAEWLSAAPSLPGIVENIPAATPDLHRIFFASVGGATYYSDDGGPAQFLGWGIGLAGRITARGQLGSAGILFPAAVEHGGQRPVSDDGTYFFHNGVGGDLRVGDLSNSPWTSESLTTSSATGDEGTLYNGNFIGAAHDASSAFFTSSARLNDDASPGGGIYRWDRASGTATQITPPGSPAGTDIQVAIASDDQSHVYFNSRQAFAPGAKAGDMNLFVWTQGGGTRFVAKLTDNVASSLTVSNAVMRMSIDGNYALFRSEGSIAGANNAGHFAIYRYDYDADETICVSCPPDGSPMQGNADLNNEPRGIPGNRGFTHSRALASDGTVVFTTTDRLAPADHSSNEDTYLFNTHTGRPELISSGRSNSLEFSGEISDDGTNIFIISREPLIAADKDAGDYDIYDVRVDGGFPEASEPDPPCEEDSCQPPPTTPPSQQTPGSSGFNGPGNKGSGSVKPCKKGKKGKKGKKCHKKGKKGGRSATTNRGGSK